MAQNFSILRADRTVGQINAGGQKPVIHNGIAGLLDIEKIQERNYKLMVMLLVTVICTNRPSCVCVENEHTQKNSDFVY